MSRIKILLGLGIVFCGLGGFIATDGSLIIHRRGSGGIQHETIGTSLEAYWNFDESSGTAYDSHTSGRDLSDNNSDVGTAEGGRHASSPASSTRLTRSGDDSWAEPSVFTIAGWYRLDSYDSNYRYILSKNDQYDYCSYQLFYSNAVALRFGTAEYGWGSWTEAVASGGTSTSTWYFVACGYDGTNTWISLNAGSRNEVSGPAPYNGTARFQFLSTDDATSGDNIHDGQIKNWGFWSKNLTSSELTYLYNSGSGRAYEDL